MISRALPAAAALAFFACTPRHAPYASTPAAAVTPSATTAPSTAQAAPPSLLPPLVGAEARRAEVRSIIAELVAQLSPTAAAKVKGIPLAFDNDANEINAFAGCENGAPYLAVTEGFLLAVDAIAQTLATDELFGSKTYDAYASSVGKRLEDKGGDPSLPPGTIPAAQESDPRRLSRAREIFDDVVAFALGHELAHHHLGHTGCANGQASTGPNPAMIGQLVTTVIPGLNQPTEVAADTAGCFNTLDTGRARRPRYAWSEQGGLWLFDFFGRLEARTPLLTAVGFLSTHPDSRLRGPIVKAAADAWRAQQPK
ncbi:MAG: M48 family metalloprotease [Polyangiales bacterium]